MADSRGVSVGASLAYAWSLLSGHWRGVWGVLALSSLDATVYLAGMFAQNPMLIGIGAAALCITALMTNGAFFRLAFADRHGDDAGYKPGPVGMQWGRMEWRMLGAALLLAVFFVILVVLVAIALAAPLIGAIMSKGVSPVTIQNPEQLAALIGPKGAAVLAGAQILLDLVVIFLGVRLALYMAATADSGRIMVLSTWRITRGHFWPILGSMLIVSLPAAMLVVLAQASAGGAAATPDPLAPAAAFLWGLVGGVAYGAFAIPLTSGVIAYYYRNLAPPPGAVR
ncbi:MAG: hypothetical protein WDM92_08870 [Caulobacteraceae bacterium]